MKKIQIFGEKMGVATTLALKGLGPQDPIKKVSDLVDPMGQPLPQKMFSNNKGRLMKLNI